MRVVNSALTCNKWLTVNELSKVCHLSREEVISQLQCDKTIISLHFYGRWYYKNKMSYNVTKLGNASNNMLDSRNTISNLGIARTCLHHLGGKLEVTIFRYAELKHLIFTFDKVNYSFTEKGKNIFSKFCKVNQTTVPCCLDFSERNFHFGGRIGNDLLNYLLEDDLCKLTKSRKVELCKEPASIVQSVFT